MDNEKIPSQINDRGASLHSDNRGVSSNTEDTGVSVRLSRLLERLLVALWGESDERRKDSLLALLIVTVAFIAALKNCFTYDS